MNLFSVDPQEENLPVFSKFRNPIRDAIIVIMLSDEQSSTLSEMIDLRPKFFVDSQ